MQLEAFHYSLLAMQKSEKQIPKPRNWLEAYGQLKANLETMRSKKKKVIFLDEISWFETPKSGFLAALDWFWNQFASRRNDIVLVICGSAASWILQKVIHNLGGLHNRITSRMQLLPFSLAETQAFLKQRGVKLVPKDLALLYMCVGGIPFYLKDVMPGKGIPQILDDLIFGPTASLKSEFQNLFASLFRNNANHELVVKALTTKNKGLNRTEISKATGIKTGGGLSLILQELVQCGFVMQVQAIGKSKEDALFKLVDEFSLFHFKFLAAGKGPAGGHLLFGMPEFKIWSGLAFESLCFKHVGQIKKVLGISGLATSLYSWAAAGNEESAGAQIDMVLDRNDNCINLFEIKFFNSKDEISKSYAAQLEQKVSAFRHFTKTRKNIFCTLITVNGSKKNVHYLSVFLNEITIDNILINI